METIDSNDDLSIQAHPDNRLAAVRHHCPGKTISPEENNTKTVPQGSAALIPTSMPRVTAEGDCRILTTYIK